MYHARVDKVDPACESPLTPAANMLHNAREGERRWQRAR
jgi:hypothetical protein